MIWQPDFFNVAHKTAEKPIQKLYAMYFVVWGLRLLLAERILYKTDMFYSKVLAATTTPVNGFWNAWYSGAVISMHIH